MENNAKNQTDMHNVRSLLLGDNNQLITKTVEENARDIVSDVISEAMHDRQRKDGSLSKAIAPIVESAVEQGIENNKANFVTYLYPIVGSLVRKSVAVFFSGFLEKLNYLIEYSLTLKGMKWRIQAWRKGVPFTKFIIQKTFIYRVEQVFLIHRETGTLLNHASIDSGQFNDASLVSAMLTAINDFMSDSFNADDSDTLNTVRTDNLTLAIQAGPEALLVAAVSGHMPNDLEALLQHTLEELHKLYQAELAAFDGDDAPFSSSDVHLRDCLLSELDTNENKKKKRPIAVILLISPLILIPIYWGYLQWQHTSFIEKLSTLTTPDGIHIQRITEGQSFLFERGPVAVEVFRDPAAVDLKYWFENQGVPLKDINIIENPFLSLNSSIILIKAEKIISHDKLTLSYENSELFIAGQLEQPLPYNITLQLQAIAGVNLINTSELTIEHINSQTSITDQQAALALMKSKIANLSIQPITFDVQSDRLNDKAKLKLTDIAQQMKLVSLLANKLSTPVGFIVSGYSDSTGTVEKNKRLSVMRANIVREYLIELDVSPTLLFSVGIGEVNIQAIAQASRKVVFSSIYLTEQDIEKEVQ